MYKGHSVSISDDELVIKPYNSPFYALRNFSLQLKHVQPLILQRLAFSSHDVKSL